MKKWFKTYIPFASNEIKKEMAYKGAFYLFIFVSLFSSFIMYYLWMVVYNNSPSDTLGGFTRDQMIIYIFMTYVTGCIVKIGVSNWISDDIEKGSIAMNLIKPINYRISLLFRSLGHSIYKLLVPGIFIWIGLELYKAFVLKTGFTSIRNIILFILSAFMSFLIYVLFDFCFSMIAFFTTYIFGMEMAKEALLTFLTGELIPLSFFPEAVSKIFEFLPFSSMNYAPIMIYLGKYSNNELLFVFLRQIAWIIILYMLGTFIWKKITTRLVVLGG
ncbi:ABC-2 family transporter protein [Clostridium sp. BJN0001]|uniref:ABC transporter permease n=1 Tax=Clostridium sp. BJN0001 TaxID=2930219 RepID=UPI001FD52643|nr:ABC-2 family transporter protein [Clostridium sp. BJN0001]